MNPTAIHRPVRIAAAALSLAGAALVASPAAGPHPTFLIHDALIVDGTGAPAYRGSVRVHGDRISSLGDLTPRPGERVVEADGHILAPGFIDPGDVVGELPRDPDAGAALSRGVTTIVVGTRGRHAYPLEAWLDSLRTARPAVNVASFAGLKTLREAAFGPGSERPSLHQAVDRIRPLLRREMGAGALGLSVAPENDPSGGPIGDLVAALTPEVNAGRGSVTSDRPGRTTDDGGWDPIPDAVRAAWATSRGELEATIHRLTGAAAAEVGIRGGPGRPRAGRGAIEPLAYADLVLLDPERLDGGGGGILRVWVNGRAAWSDGRTTGSRSGRVIRWPRM